MRCVECAAKKNPEERGWVTVLSPSGAARIHYCPACIANLVRHAYAVDESGDTDSD
jgi:hypothetical protein